nr:hypothetical protein [Microvirga zambiensis]
MREPARTSRRKRLSPRGIAEAAATVVIALGVVMLMQPLSLTLYGWSFPTTLVGTVMFLIGSKLPE